MRELSPKDASSPQSTFYSARSFESLPYLEPQSPTRCLIENSKLRDMARLPSFLESGRAGTAEKCRHLQELRPQAVFANLAQQELSER